MAVNTRIGRLREFSSAAGSGAIALVVHVEVGVPLRLVRRLLRAAQY